ncbi:MAG: insulinase family protein, partial [Bacteroidota bacterium]
YSVGGSFGADYVTPGVFYASTNTQSESTVEAAQAMLEVIENMKTTPPTAQELALAKDSYLNSYVFRFDTKSEVLGRLLTYTYYDYPEDFLVRLQEGIAAVTAEDVQRVAQTYLRPQDAKIMILGNSAEFTTPVTALGTPEEVDITIPTTDPSAPPEASGDPVAGAELLGRVFDAVGGREAWGAVESYASAGSFTGPTPFGVATIASQSLIGGADKIRVEQATPVGNILLQLDGSTATLSVGGATQPTGPGFASTIRSQLLFSLPYLMAFPEGLEVARMADTEDGFAVLRITASGVVAPYDLIVGEDGKPARIESTQPGQTGPVRLVYAFSDYREVGGVMLPFTTVQTTDGEDAGTTTLESFTANPEMPEGAFGG